MSNLTWRNDTRKLADLIPQEDNPRQITKAQAERLLKSWDKFDQVETLAVGPDGSIYNGHQRYYVLLAAHDDPQMTVDVRVASRALTRREWQELTVLLHEGATGEWSFDALANWDGVDVGDLVEWGFSEEALLGAGWELGAEPAADPGAQVDKAAELQEKWQVQPGDLWEIGRHRLICGDCTDAAVVARVMGGGEVAAILTDPPYGVDYDGGTKKRHLLAGDDSPALYYPFLVIGRERCADYAALYLFYADGDAAVTQAVTQAGFEVRNTLIWNKNQAQFGALSAQYKQKHEPFLYCHLKGKSPQWFGPKNEVTVWDIDRASINELHPTQKPPELFQRAIRNSTQQDDIILDGFCGSGTTIVACEQLGRQCRAVEIEPKYCAVTLERLAGMGLELRRIE